MGESVVWSPDCLNKTEKGIAGAGCSMFYRGGWCVMSIFSIFSSRFSMASSRFSICLRSLPTSSGGSIGRGVGDGHLLSSGLSGLLKGWGDGNTAFFSSSDMCISQKNSCRFR